MRKKVKVPSDPIRHQRVKLGDRIVFTGYGQGSGRTVHVIPMTKIPTTGRGIPNLPGHDRPIEKGDVAIKYDDTGKLDVVRSAWIKRHGSDLYIGPWSPVRQPSRAVKKNPELLVVRNNPKRKKVKVPSDPIRHHQERIAERGIRRNPWGQSLSSLRKKYWSGRQKGSKELSAELRKMAWLATADTDTRSSGRTRKPVMRNRRSSMRIKVSHKSRNMGGRLKWGKTEFSSGPLKSRSAVMRLAERLHAKKSAYAQHAGDYAQRYWDSILAQPNEQRKLLELDRTHSNPGRKRKLMKRRRNLPLKKRYGGKYFTVKAFARKYAKKFGGKARARKQWSRLRDAKHGRVALRVARNKGRSARKSRRNFRRR